MANLITSIIAIALVAVIAIAGIYYGSSAYQEAQAKGQANTILSLARQIKTAHLAYRATGGAAITGQVNLHTTSNYLVSGGFISGAISGNTSFVTTGNTGRLATHIISENGVSIGERVLVAGVKKTICEQIVLVSTGSKELGRYDSVTPDATWNAYKDSNGLGMLDRLKKFEFDCYYRDLNGDSIFDEAAGESAHFHMLMTIGF